MSEQTWSGGCHCKKVRYEVSVDASKGISCNCSMCGKKGAILGFVPESAFTLRSGEGELSDYQFNKQVIHHLFCKTCGVTSFARGKKPDGTPMVAVNLRCLDDVDLDSIELQKVDGKKF